MRKAQVSIVMAVCVVILIIMGLVVTLESTGVLNLVPNTQGEIGNYIQDCLALTTQESLNVLGRNGGYKEPLNPLAFQSLSVLFKDNQSQLPSKVELERRLADLIKTDLKSCIDFDLFKGYEILKEGDINADVSINKKDVTIVLSYPLTIKLGDNQRSFDTFVTKENVKLFNMHKNAEHMINHQKQELNVIDITPLHTDHQLFISEREGHLIVSMHDPNYKIDNKPFKFQFAI